MIAPETLALLWPREARKQWPHPARTRYQVVQEGDPAGMVALVLEPPSEEEIARLAGLAQVPAHALRVVVVSEG